jgi:hypothetical protein
MWQAREGWGRSVVSAQADVGAGREVSQEECAQRSLSQSPAPHSLIPFRLRASNKRELQHNAVVQPQRDPEMVVTHNFHLLRSNTSDSFA